jgi:hypothetical protein
MQVLRLLRQIFFDFVDSNEQNLYLANFFYDKYTCSKASMLEKLVEFPTQTSNMKTCHMKACHRKLVIENLLSIVTGLSLYVCLGPVV